MASAVIYTRVSSEEQADSGLGLADQEARCRAYCAMRSLEVVEVVSDPGVSGGREFARREGGARVLELTRGRAPRAQHVVVLKLDRGFRGANDCLDVTEAWDKRKVSLHVVDLGGSAVDTRSATGKFMLTVFAGVAEMERNLGSERTRSALSVKRTRGEFCGGDAPYGWSLVEGELVQVEAEQETLAEARELRASGLTLREVSAELAERGKLSRTGRPFAATQVARMAPVARVG